MVAVIAAASGVLGLAGVFLVLFLKNSSANSDRADALVAAEHARGELAAMTADRDTQKNRGDAEKARADALDDLIAKHAAAAAGPVDGSFKRLLQEWATPSHAAPGGSPGALPAAPATAAPGPSVDDLLKPGD